VGRRQEEGRIFVRERGGLWAARAAYEELVRVDEPVAVRVERVEEDPLQRARDGARRIHLAEEAIRKGPRGPTIRSSAVVRPDALEAVAQFSGLALVRIRDRRRVARAKRLRVQRGIV
jgi:hypothetical protein